jgi:hypothetical protein
MLSVSEIELPPPVNWQAFEHLCWCLWTRVWNDPNTKKNGRSGHSRNGV